MSKEAKKTKKKCGSKKGLLLAFGLTTLASRVITAISLAAITLSLCSINKESKAFNDCVEEVRDSTNSASAAVNYCKGGQ